SAGADPGPACYGLGGREPTVTDANLVLGHLDPAVPLAGGVRLDAQAAQAAVAALARTIAMDVRECAQGIRRIACAEMAGALRVVTVNRGVDPRRYALMAFGGAGPLHATDIADELGIDRILVPRASGVLAALGLVVSPQRRDVQRSVLLSGEQLTPEAIGRHVEELTERATRELGAEPAAVAVLHEVRYRGQSFELPVSAAPAELREAFEAEHEARYGYRDPALDLELVTIRVSARLEAPCVSLPEFEFSRREKITGPSVVRLPESTLVVAPWWEGTIDPGGTIDLRRTS
ncbi:MAG TPA: hydantoinase/oxoprolinase family protein, partial [Solirubrobacteraceae bacterium]|nr:hydantoinase/oxoprolinase family protein [Solirubrobacteraceae bacterium]